MFKMMIADRDGWRCHLCGEPVSKNKTPWARKGPTIDHIIPRSKGGSDDIDNLRLAHRKCNEARGNSDLPDALAQGWGRVR